MKYVSYLPVILLLFFTACKPQNDSADAYGNFEAIEVIVSAETSGKIITFLPGEGEQLLKDQVSVTIDTTQLYLKKAALESGFSSLSSRILTLDAQLRASKVQLDNLKRERDRIDKLVEGGAATTKQQDDIHGQVALMEAQMRMSSLEGIFVCPEGGATLAALEILLKDGWISREERIVLFNTGTGLKYPDVFDM